MATTSPSVPDDSQATAELGPVDVGPEELNQWKRGFTPQAEIWNGRMAMVGLSVGLTVLLIARLAGRA
ncbi:MAG: hypothetical protein RLZZ533_12 [Cyanobacteriota bacterium]|jgi:hypothetical protein